MHFYSTEVKQRENGISKLESERCPYVCLLKITPPPFFVVVNGVVLG